MNLVTNKLYVANTTGDSVTVLTEQQVQAIPLTNTVTPLVDNTTHNRKPTFQFSASSSFMPIAPPVNGTATFFLNGTPLTTVNLQNGMGVFTTSTLPRGTDNIQAVYSGDINFRGSRSNTVAQMVN